MRKHIFLSFFFLFFKKFSSIQFSAVSGKERIDRCVRKMEEENVFYPEVVEHHQPKPKAALKVSLSFEKLPNFEKCCFVINLKVGLNVWLVIEAIIWTFLFIAALYHEFIFANEINLDDFFDETRTWYFYLIFGTEFEYLDQRIRSELIDALFSLFYHVMCENFFPHFCPTAYIILFNLMLTLIFLTYLAFCLVLLLGINMVS